MTLTLLVDLDDTLLDNDMSTFVPAYLQALGGYLDPRIPARRLVPALLAATQTMIQNQRPDRTLKEVFDTAFYPELGLEAQDLQQEIGAFYAQVFPSLRGLTHPRKAALELIEHARLCSYRVVIATNPLFPRTAILQRLDWAGIDPELFSIALVPSYETMHFAKPNPAYYAEILASIGWPTGPVVMVGDDPFNDVIPARQLGLPVYWITPGQKPAPGDPLASTGVGTLEEFIPWVEQSSQEMLTPNYGSEQALPIILRSTPAALFDLTAGLPPSAFTECPAPGEWCLAEILCHLRDVDAEVNLPRLTTVLNANNPFLPGMDTDPWAVERNYKVQDGATALERFTQARLELLSSIDSLKSEDWQRPARHAIFGPTNLKELVSIIAGHDRLHIQQVYQTLGKQS